MDVFKNVVRSRPLSTVVFTLAANAHEAKLKKQIVHSVLCIFLFEALRKAWHWNTNDRKSHRRWPDSRRTKGVSAYLQT